MGVLDGATTGTADVHPTGRHGRHVTRGASVVAEGPLDSAAPLVVQVSRWDHLKDMGGVMAGFAARVTGRGDAQLALVGPAVDDVSDDPEGRRVLEECIDGLERVAMLGSADGSDCSACRWTTPTRTPPWSTPSNGHATVIVQKSLAEGFGLTVAEGMWKAKAVVASAVGGIVDQVVAGDGRVARRPHRPRRIR